VHVFVASVLVGVLVPVLRSADPMSLSSPGGESAAVSVAPDESSARALARRLNRPVEVSMLGTETSRVLTKPDGTLLMEQHTTPFRLRRGTGWSAVDTTLERRADGSIGTLATPADLTVSSGGLSPGPFVTLSYRGRELSLGWPGALPRPALAGNTATYPEVLPDVDLVVRAGVDSFSEVLVVKTRAAAANPALSRIRLLLRATGLSVRAGPDGGLVAVDASGQTVFGAAAPSMWDATLGDGPPHTAPMRMELGDGELVIVPDRRLLDDPDIRYPVYIDPTVGLGVRQWGNVTANAPNQGIAADPFRGEGAKAGLGQDANGSYLYRSVFAFWLGPLHGKHILRATFAANLYHSWSCSDTPVELWLTSGINDGSSWNNTTWMRGLDTRSGHAHSGCAGPARMEFGNGLAGAVQQGADARWPDITLGLRASNESDVFQWKRFYADASLSVEYNSRPDTPDQLDTGGKPCATGANRPFVATTTPSLNARMNDADTDQMQNAGFSWAPLGAGLSNTFWQNNLPPGTRAQAPIPAGKLVDGGTYYWQVVGNDNVDTSPSTGSCEFTVDVTPPLPAKAISSTDYPADGSFHGGVGRLGRFTVAPPDLRPDDVVGYLIGLNQCNQPTCARSVPADASHGASFDLTPDLDGRNVMYVWTKDRADNLGDPVHPLIHTFLVRSGTGPAAYWRMNDGNSATLNDSAGHGNTATSFGTTWLTPTGLVDNGTGFITDAVSGYAATAGPVQTRDQNTGNLVSMRTDGSFTVSAWLNAAIAGGNFPTPTAVSADGNRNSAYLLGYSWNAGNPRWRFDITQSDVDNGAVVSVLGTSPVQENVWTYVVGSYDAATKTMRLYVNGALEGSATIAGTFNATGPLAIGRARRQGAPGQYWWGEIDETRVYDRVLTATEVGALARPLPPALTVPARVVSGRTFQAYIFDAGDPNITSYRYSVNDTSLSSTATPDSPGGDIAVPIAAGPIDTYTLYVAAVDARGRVSDLQSMDFDTVAAPTLSGVITSAQSGQPIAGAPVTLSQSGVARTTTSASDGSYRFDTVDLGPSRVSSWSGSRCTMSGSSAVGFSGGPVTTNVAMSPFGDGFGYSCLTTGTPFVPADATVLPLTGNLAQLPVTLPFPVPYYGLNYTKIWVDTDGYLSFVDPGPSAASGSIPNATKPNGVVAPFWTFMTIDSQSGVRTATLGTAPNRAFVVEWRNVGLFGLANERMSFEAILGENGDITFNYSGLDDNSKRGGSATVGVENTDGTVGMGYLRNEPLLANNTAIVFKYPGGQRNDPLWSLTGKVTDATTGAAMAGTPVVLTPSAATTTTASDGSYSFTNLPTGRYTVSVAIGGRCGRFASSTLDLSAPSIRNLTVSSRKDGYYSCAEGSAAFQPADATILGLGGDTGVVPVSMPFPVTFYGKQYGTGWVDINGHLTLVQDLEGSSPYGDIPSTEPPNAVVAPFWTDLLLDAQSSVRTAVIGTAPSRQFVVEWRNVILLGQRSQPRLGFEVVFAENGDITFNYTGVDSPDEQGTSAVVGLENETGLAGFSWSSREPAVGTNHTITFHH
jgi:hypothetical protein